MCMTRKSKSNPFRPKGSRKAFTLFEVVVAITILSVAISGVLVSFNGMNEAHRLIERRTEASLLARNVIARVRNQALNPESEETEGQFAGTDYRYKIEFATTDWDKLYAVSINIQWGDEEQPEGINLYTLQHYEKTE